MNKSAAMLNLKYGGIHATYWMYYSISCSFSSAFLLACGYSNGEIGVILAAGSVAAVFIQPLIADFADRSKKLSIAGVSQLVTVLLMFLTILLFVLQKKSAALWIIYVMIVAWITSLQPLVNSLAFKLEETGVHINFGLCRSAGSLFYSVICALLGTLVEKAGIDVLPASGVIVLAMLFTVVLLAERQFRSMCGGCGGCNSDVEPKIEGQETEEINLSEFIGRNKIFVVMNIGVTGIFFSNAILNNFMLQIVDNVGGTGEDMGRILSVMAFMEIPALIFFDRIKKHFSDITLLKIASISFALKIIIIYLAEDVQLIYAAHLLQPFSFGLFLPAMVSFINEKMASGEAVKGQALFTAMTTMGTVISSITGGLMLDFRGAGFMLLAASAVTAAGAAVVILFVGKVK